jgi:hypothetical protein
MIVVRGKAISLACQETGRGLTLVDERRGARWLLDEKSLVHGSTTDRHYWNPVGERFPLVPETASVDGRDGIKIRYGAGDGTGFEVRFTVMDDCVEVCIDSGLDEPMGFVSLPGSFAPQEEKPRLLLPIMQGMLYDGRGPSIDHVVGEARHAGFAMAFFGVLGSRGALVAIAETRDDCCWWYGRDDAGRMWATNLQTASLGALRYPRAVRLCPADPDIVSVARTYRARLARRGHLASWEEKAERRPAIKRLFGALMCYVGYCRDDVDYLAGCRELRAMGFDRALLYPGRFNVWRPGIRMGGQPAIDMPHDLVQAIRGLGYDVAPWSWIMEALDDEAARRMYRRDRNGSTLPNWAIDDQRWSLVCHSFMEERQRAALRGEIPDMSWDHFDVLSCLPPGECYANDHPGHPGRPSTRAEDREFIRRTFAADTEAGLLVSSESFNDAYARDLDFGSVKAWPQFGPWIFWPVPLTMLVHHDGMIHSWWELHSYNNGWRGKTTHCGGLYEYGGGRPRLMAACDALMGCPPDVFPFGAQYGYTGRGVETFLYKYRLDDPEVRIALREALPVARLHARIGMKEMVHFRILSDDGWVQESAFSDGTRIVANFSRDFIGSVPGGDQVVIPGVPTLAPESWTVAE